MSLGYKGFGYEEMMVMVNILIFGKGKGQVLRHEAGRENRNLANKINPSPNFSLTQIHHDCVFFFLNL